MSDIIRVSHSQIQTWNRCRMQWFFKYVENWVPSRKAYPLTFGSLVHNLLENYYQGVIDEVPDLLQHHQNYVKVLSGSVADTDELQALSHGASLISRYITDFAFFEDADYNVVATEKHYEVELETPKGHPFIFELYFDLLLQHKDDKKLWMVDHKTHRSNPWSEAQILMDPQLPSYALVMRELLGVEVFGLMYNLLNSYEYKKPPHPDKLFQRHKTYRTDTELNSMLRELGLTVDEMIEGRDSIRRTLQRDCDRCDFQDPCLMGMKGFDMNNFMDAFEKKGKRDRDSEESNQTLNII